MGLEVYFYALKKTESEKGYDSRSLISAYVRSTCEALADALGLDGTGGVPDPDEPGDWFPSPVDPTKIDWEKLARIERLDWSEGVTVEVIKDLVTQGYLFEFNPSY